jgi:hypothetical protein
VHFTIVFPLSKVVTTNPKISRQNTFCKGQRNIARKGRFRFPSRANSNTTDLLLLVVLLSLDRSRDRDLEALATTNRPVEKRAKDDEKHDWAGIVKGRRGDGYYGREWDPDDGVDKVAQGQEVD